MRPSAMLRMAFSAMLLSISSRASVRKRDNHGLSGSAGSIRGTCAIPGCKLRILLMYKEAPGELDHSATNAGVAGFSETAFAALFATFIRCACEPRIPCYRFPVAQVA